MTFTQPSPSQDLENATQPNPTHGSTQPMSISGSAAKCYYKLQKSAQNGSEMQGKAYNSEMVRNMAIDKCTPASKERRLQISRVMNLGSVFELSGVAFRLFTH